VLPQAGGQLSAISRGCQLLLPSLLIIYLYNVVKSRYRLQYIISALQDLVKDAAPHFKKAKQHYDQIAKQLVGQGHALDIFACSLDQVCNWVWHRPAISSRKGDWGDFLHATFSWVICRCAPGK